MRILAAAVIIPTIAGAVAWGFIESRQEREVETKRERAVKALLSLLACHAVVRFDQDRSAFTRPLSSSS